MDRRSTRAPRELGMHVEAPCGMAARNFAFERVRAFPLLPTLVLYEWLRGPRVEQELAAQEALFAGPSSIPFGPDEARLAARICRAIARQAELWTLNLDDFSDIPQLRVSRPRPPPQR